MLAIGVAEHEWLVYEGDGNHGHAVWPSPMLAIATVLYGPEDTAKIPRSTFLNEATFVFREDSFDPVTRIRRGRIYKTPATQPQDWKVQAHPAYSGEVEEVSRAPRVWLQKRLNGLHAWPAFQELRGRTASTLIALGTSEAYTLWRVVDIERIVTGEDLLTLRARTALGILPELNRAAVPEEGRDKVIETLDKLSEAAYRSGPEAVVELARGAAQWCLGVWLAHERDDPTLRMLDLMPLANKLAEDRLISKSLAQILARLHSRVKLNEQEKYQSRPIREDDAEFALAAVGMLMRELGWVI